MALGRPRTVCPSKVAVIVHLGGAVLAHLGDLPVISSSAPSPSSGTSTGPGELRGGLDDRAGIADPVGDDPSASGHGEHAVRDDVGQSDLGGEPLVPVDRVEVAGGAGVADQVGRG